MQAPSYIITTLLVYISDSPTLLAQVNLQESPLSIHSKELPLLAQIAFRFEGYTIVRKRWNFSQAQVIHCQEEKYITCFI